MNKELRLHKCTPEDIDAVMLLQDEIISELPDKDVLRKNTKETFLNCLSEPSISIGIYDGDSLAGIGMAAYVEGTGEDLSVDLHTPRTGRAINMKLVMIKKDYYGLGLQRMIMEILEHNALERGFDLFCSTVSPDNVYSMRNVINCGYELDHSAIKYGGLKRNIYVKSVSLSDHFKYFNDLADNIIKENGPDLTEEYFAGKKIIKSEKDLLCTGDMVCFDENGINKRGIYFSGHNGKKGILLYEKDNGVRFAESEEIEKKQGFTCFSCYMQYQSQKR